MGKFNRLYWLATIVAASNFLQATGDYVTLNYPGAESGSSTYLTGIRGDNVGGVYMTDVYTPPSSSGTQGLLYQGPVIGGGDWYLLNRPDTIGQVTTSTAMYGPNTLPGGVIRAAGSYKTEAGGARDFGLMYEGTVNGVCSWQQLTPTVNGDTT